MTLSSLKRLALAVLFLFAVPFVAAACDEEETAGPETGTDVEDVADDEVDTIDDTEYGIYEENEFGEFEDNELVGQTVTVSADINRIIEPGKALVLGQDTGGLLVLTPPKLKDVPALEPGKEIQVVGLVVDFAVADIERDYEPFDLNDDLYTDWENETALVAQSISLAPTEEAAEADEAQ